MTRASRAEQAYAIFNQDLDILIRGSAPDPISDPDEVIHLFYSYVKTRFSVSNVSVTGTELVHILTGVGAPSDLLDEVRALTNAVDALRYANAGISSEERFSLVERIRTVASQIEAL